MLRYVASRYPYVSHVVCNAGVAPFLRISWLLVLQQFWQDLRVFKPFEFATHPRYNIQRSAMVSDDGLGWVWQCNVFGHYVIVRPLPLLCCPMLTRSASSVVRSRRSSQRRRHDRASAPRASCGCHHSRRTQAYTMRMTGSSCRASDRTRAPNSKLTSSVPSLPAAQGRLLLLQCGTSPYTPA